MKKFKHIFQTLDGEKIMLPVMDCVFLERKLENGEKYLVATFNFDQYKIKCTMFELQRLISSWTNEDVFVQIEKKVLTKS